MTTITEFKYYAALSVFGYGIGADEEDAIVNLMSQTNWAPHGEVRLFEVEKHGNYYITQDMTVRDDNTKNWLKSYKTIQLH